MLDFKMDARSRRNLRNLENCDAMLLAVRRGIKKGFLDLGKDAQRNTRRLILNPPKTGRIYKRKGGVLHQASAPGENPANETGKLAKSVGYTAHAHEMEFGYRAYYGKWLEEGTRDGRIQPRPTLQYVGHRAAAVGTNYFEGHIKKNIGRLFK